MEKLKINYNKTRIVVWGKVVLNTNGELTSNKYSNVPLWNIWTSAFISLFYGKPTYLTNLATAQHTVSAILIYFFILKEGNW